MKLIRNFMDSLLIDNLKTKQDGEKLVQILQQIEENAKPLLDQIKITFPEFTPHDIEHKKRVLKRLELLIPTCLMEKLSSSELYFLIAATYLHDVGMADLESLPIPESYQHDQKKKADYIRKTHHTRSEEFINNNFQSLGIEDVHQAFIIGRICCGHRVENLYDTSKFEPEKIYKSDSINVALLSSLLRIGDELDLTFERTPMIIYENIPPKDDISTDEWEHHIDTSGVKISNEDPLLIKCSARCSNSRIHRILKRMEDKINDELENLPNHLHYFRECKKDIPRKFQMIIDNVDYTPYDLKFSLKEKAIVRLLMGEKLYKNNIESLRELLKNSIDGCKLRNDELKKKHQSYTPEIIFHRDGDVVTIEDNGVGMDEEKIDRYFTKIGQSFYKSTEFQESDHEFTPVSELGIGILSCFMLADKIEVETKMDDSKALIIEIDDLSDYFIVKNSSKVSTGTKVKLYLKKELDDFDLTNIVKMYARHIDFPIIVRDNGEEIKISDDGFNFTTTSLFGWNNPNYDLYTIHLNENFIEGRISLFGRVMDIENKNYWLPDRLGYRIRTEKQILSNEGIYVNEVDVLPPWMNDSEVYCDLNLHNNSLDLTVARNDIVDNSKLIKLHKQLEEKIIPELSSLLTTLDKELPDDDAEFNNKTRIDDFFNIYMDKGYAVRRWGWEARQTISEEFKKFINTFYYYSCFTKEGIILQHYDDIINSKKQIIIVMSADENKSDYIQHLIQNTDTFSDDVYYIFESIDRSYVDLSFSRFDDNANVDHEYFWRFFSYKEDYRLNDIIQRTWKLVEFTNYKSKFVIENFPTLGTVVNKNHKFIELLLNNVNTLNKIDAENFFRGIKLNLKKSNFNKILSLQKVLLEPLIKNNIIQKNDESQFLLSENDFPDYMFK